MMKPEMMEFHGRMMTLCMVDPGLNKVVFKVRVPVWASWSSDDKSLTVWFGGQKTRYVPRKPRAWDSAGRW